MFEITGNDINELNDTDLRTLVGLLCEAELHCLQRPTAGVTWGGHQTAADGGIDVRVELSSPIHADSFIPRALTGYQVKKSDMQRAKILKEMRPNNKLRPVIQELVDAHGAYIIVSAASTTDSVLKNRKTAMSEALSGIPNASNLKLDFYDRDRVAYWVRCHPSLIFWVKDRIGRSLQGWSPYCNWAYSQADTDEEYLLDEGVRLHNSISRNPDGMNAIDGINALRNALAPPASSVRLVGLSGVGKTRLLQALFDSRIGNKPLPQSQVIYTDMGLAPTPAPVALAERLRALKKPSILAVDNCPPKLHRSLTAICTASGSLISLITVEYDIRDDQPEETEVFRLEPASVALVEKIIQIRYQHISPMDSYNIAEFSGGNARIAIALANTVAKGQSLGTLKHTELFERLFYQGQHPDSTLLKLATVCSLVYSFDIRTEEGANTELTLLAKLANTSIDELFARVAELKRRDLVQQRGVWRAVLPHALANKLAQQALEDIPPARILDVFERGGSTRLLQSFSKRLSYLHESPQAIAIAERWLSKQGLLSDVCNLNDLHINILINIAPVAPEATLVAIENAANSMNGQYFASKENRQYSEFTHLLRSLAYDAELFDRCAALLCRFALSEKPTDNNNSIRDLFKSLFFIKYSGTHALATQRLGIIKPLINADSEDKQELGLLLLGCTLEAWHFGNHFSYDFGARSRDYGYSPKAQEDIQQWFEAFTGLAKDLIVSGVPIATKVKRLLANKFRGLWIQANVFDVLEPMANSIIKETAWNEGWIAVRTTLRLDAKQMPPDILSQLQKLEDLLRPDKLLEKARAYAFSDVDDAFSLIDGEFDERNESHRNDLHRQIEQIRLEIAKEVAVNENVFDALLLELLTVEVRGAGLCSFAKGLAEGTDKPLEMWAKFRNQLATIAVDKQKYTVLICFFCTLWQKNPDLAEQILNDAVADEFLGACFPRLQLSVPINDRGVERLKQSLDIGLASVDTYKDLIYNRTAEEALNDTILCDLLKKLALKPDGVIIAIDILDIWLHFTKKTVSDTIALLGQHLLAQVNFDRNNRHELSDDRLAQLVELCLVNERAKATAIIFCSNIAKALSTYTINLPEIPRLLKSLAQQQPRIFLENLFDGIESKVFLLRHHDIPKLLAYVDDSILIEWSEVDPPCRYAKAAEHIAAYRFNEHKNGLEWTPLALRFMANAPDVVSVLNAFRRQFKPNGWSGSRANIMESHLILISELKTHQNPEISAWACNEEKIFAEEIKQEHDSENERNRTEERFE